MFDRPEPEVFLKGFAQDKYLDRSGGFTKLTPNIEKIRAVIHFVTYEVVDGSPFYRVSWDISSELKKKGDKPIDINEASTPTYNIVDQGTTRDPDYSIQKKLTDGKADGLK